MLGSFSRATRSFSSNQSTQPKEPTLPCNHPILPETLWTFGSIAQVRVTETLNAWWPALWLPVNGLMSPNCFSAG